MILKKAKRIAKSFTRTSKFDQDSKLVVSANETIKLRKKAAELIGATVGDCVDAFIIGAETEDEKFVSRYSSVSEIYIQKRTDVEDTKTSRLGKALTFKNKQTAHALAQLGGTTLEKGFMLSFNVSETPIEALSLAPKDATAEELDEYKAIGKIFKVTFDKVIDKDSEEAQDAAQEAASTKEEEDMNASASANTSAFDEEL